MQSRFAEIIENPDQIASLSTEDEQALLQETAAVVGEEPKLIELPSTGRAIFVGDTHGDFDATKKVVAKYLSEGNRVVFLGDYVDRGPQPQQNINYLCLLKLTYPEDIFLLMGNHEAHQWINFFPADFWWTLEPERYARYTATFSKLPLAVSVDNGVLALHGGLPDVANLDDINRVELGTEQWVYIIWGDFQDMSGGFLTEYVGRPQFGRDYFEEVMARFNKRLLIRSHQPRTPVLYDRRCLTIFTSSAYPVERTVAIVDLEKEPNTVDDFVIEMI